MGAVCRATHQTLERTVALELLAPGWAEGDDEALHRREIWHRDVKPANVFVTAEGLAKRGDLGLARSSGSTRLREPGARVGSAACMAPELLRGAPAFASTDLHALGVTPLEERVIPRSPGYAPICARGGSAASAITRARSPRWSRCAARRSTAGSTVVFEVLARPEWREALGLPVARVREFPVTLGGPRRSRRCRPRTAR